METIPIDGFVGLVGLPAPAAVLYIFVLWAPHCVTPISGSKNQLEVALGQQ